MPLESSLHLSQSDVFRIQQAYTGEGFNWIYAVAFEDLEKVTRLYRVSLSSGGLIAFNHRCAHFNYVLCAPDLSSAIICSATGEYLVVAGPQNFVEIAAGKSKEVACLEFKNFGNDPAFSPSQREYFSALFLKLCEEYQKTPEGRAVVFPLNISRCENDAPP